MKLLSNLTGTGDGTPVAVEGTKPFWSRSAVRLWLFSFALVVVTAWAAGAPIVEAIRKDSVRLLIELAGALGLAGLTQSGKVVK